MNHPDILGLCTFSTISFLGWLIKEFPEQKSELPVKNKRIWY